MKAVDCQPVFILLFNYLKKKWLKKQVCISLIAP